jgi:hypothetical protein
MNGTKWICSLMLGGALIVAGCESKEETPSGAAAPVPEASEAASDASQAKTEDASERAKSAAEKAGDSAVKQAENASDAMKKNADAAAESVAADPKMAEYSKQIEQVKTYIVEKKWDLAESTLKTLETNKASLSPALQTQVANTRTMLDAAKKGLGATSVPAIPKL